MKLIFLDIDGVLNSQDWWDWAQAPHNGIDRLAVNRLKQIQEQSDALIVISSNWRWVNTLPTLQFTLQLNGVSHHHVIGVTPRLEGEIRGKEIELYIKTFPFRCEPIESFVILDDVELMGDLEHRLVRTTEKKGLQDEHINLALKILDEPWEPDMELT